jgi:hypothetical protein
MRSPTDRYVQDLALELDAEYAAWARKAAAGCGMANDSTTSLDSEGRPKAPVRSFLSAGGFAAVAIQVCSWSQVLHGCFWCLTMPIFCALI